MLQDSMSILRHVTRTLAPNQQLHTSSKRPLPKPLQRGPGGRQGLGFPGVWGGRVPCVVHDLAGERWCPESPKASKP